MAKKPIDFTFDPETHTYLVGGKRLPSITQLMAPLKDFSGVPAEVLKRAQVWGTAVHSVVEYHIEGTLDVETMDELLLGPYTAFLQWEADHGMSGLNPVCEKKFFHPRLGFAGTPDLIYDDKRWIVEVKTRKFDKKTDPVQTAGQQLLWQANGGSKGYFDHFVLELRLDGTYEFTPANHKQALGIFRKLIESHNINTMLLNWKGN